MIYCSVVKYFLVCKTRKNTREDIIKNNSKVVFQATGRHKNIKL